MRHVFGMAKSSLDLNGAKAQKLELDVLRLIYAVQHNSERGDIGHGYILVLEEALARRVQLWLTKYDAVTGVICLCQPPNTMELAELRREKQTNLEGMLAGIHGNHVGRRSDAALGRRSAETALERMIVEREPGVVRITEAAAQPFAIRWDYYGTRQ